VPSRYRRAARATAQAGAGNEVENVVIYLEPLEGAPPRRPTTERPRLDQKDLMFVPHVLPVAVGTTVEITNQDGIYHNVFSLSGAKKFNIGRRPTGEVATVTFEDEGVVQVFCDIHATMSAFIVVLETPWFATPAEDGSFRIDGVPAGRYRLQAWHDERTAEPRVVEVGPGGLTGLEVVLR
jgi:plastocyanin